MNPYPHHYEVRAAGKTQDGVEVSAEQLPPLRTAPPVHRGDWRVRVRSIRGSTGRPIERSLVAVTGPRYACRRTYLV